MLSRAASLNRAAVLVGTLMGLGVAATFVREVLFARIFGTGHELESFRLAFAIPNLLGTSLATTIVAALLPLMARLNDGPGGERAALTEAVMTTGLLAVVLSLLGLLTAEWQAAAMAPGFDVDDRAELTRHIRVLWGFFALLALSFGPRAFLSMRGTVWPMASANLVLGGTMAAGLLGLAWAPVSLQTAETMTWIALLAASCVLGVHIFALPRRALFDVWAERSRHRTGLLTMTSGSLFIVFIGHLINASPRLLDRSAGTELGSGTVAALDFSFSIITVPGVALGSVFVIAAAPRLSAAVKAGSWSAVGFLSRRALACVLMAFAAGGLLAVLGGDVISLVYAGGAFDAAAVELTSRILVWHAASLGPMVATIILSQAALVLGLVRLFFVVAIVRIVGKWLSLGWLVPAYGIDGLAASFLVPEVLAAGIFLVALLLWHRRRVSQ